MRSNKTASNTKRAGQSAQRKYDELTKSWRRRNARLFTVLGLICGCIAGGSLIAAKIWPEASYAAGFAAGLASAFFLLLWLSPPGWIENWQVGAWGEEATAKALMLLDGTQWSVLHDITTEYGNVDHIAVGPGGIFVLDSKRLGGRVSVEDGVVRVQRLDDEDLSYVHSGGTAIRRQAAMTSERIMRATRIKQWVRPVMVVWADFPQRIVEGDCAIVHGDDLVAWLESQPLQIASANVPRISAAVRTAWAVGS